MTAATVHLVDPLTAPSHSTGVTPVNAAPQPDREPAAAGNPRALLALAGLVMLGVLLASISGIAEVASLVKMQTVNLPPLDGGLPIAVPIGTIGLILAWDGLQITAAWALHAGRDRAALVLLITTATASGAAQGWAGVIGVLKSDPNASWGFLFVVALVHASPAVALIGAEWLVFRAAAQASRPHMEVVAEPTPTTPVLEDLEVEPAPERQRVALTSVTPVSRSAPAPRPSRAKPSSRSVPVPSDELLKRVHIVLEALDVTADEATVDLVLVELRARGWGVHKSKVSAALDVLKENPL